MDIGIRVEGIKGFEEMQRKLGRRFMDDEIRKSLKSGLTVVQEQMKMNLSRHDKTGRLMASVNIDKDRMLSRFGSAVYRVGRRLKKGDWKGMAYHAHLVEYGTKARTDYPKRGKKLYVPIYGQGGMVLREVKSRTTKGTKAYMPFNRAIDSTKDRALALAEQGLLKIVEERANIKLR